jgi:hypothetical protein
MLIENVDLFPQSLVVGATLNIRPATPSDRYRPTVRGLFRARDAYVLFCGHTKVAVLSGKAVDSIGLNVPEICTVLRVNSAERFFEIEFL